MCKICCKLFIFQYKTMCQLNECSVSPITAFWNENTHDHFTRTGATTPKSEPSELQNLCGNTAEVYLKKFIMCWDRHYAISGTALSYASSITQQVSGVTSPCARSRQMMALWVFSLPADYTHVYFNVLFWRKLQVSWFYYVKYIRISLCLIFTK